MGWVDHKKIRDRIASRRSAISDETLFTSRIFAAHLEEIVAVQLNRYKYKRRVKIKIYWDAKDPFIAATNHTLIIVNAGNPLVTREETRTDRYHVIVGLVVHELGHVLYTDFKESKQYYSEFMNFRWYPELPTLSDKKYIKNEKAFWEYAKEDEKNAEALANVAKNIINIIEDGYVENRMLSNFPGTLGYALDRMRLGYREQLPTITELKEKEGGDKGLILFSIMQIMLSYALYGDIKYGEESVDDERLQAVFKLLTKIDYSIMSREYKDRLNVVNEIMICCWEYVRDFCERSKALTAMGEELSDVIEGEFSSLIGISVTGSGDSSPVMASDDEKPTLVTMERRKKTVSEIEEKTKKEDEEEPEEPTETPDSESSDTETTDVSKDSESASEETEADGDETSDDVAEGDDVEEISEESEESEESNDEEEHGVDEDQLSLDDVKDEVSDESTDDNVDGDGTDEQSDETDNEDISTDAGESIKETASEGKGEKPDTDCAEYSEGGSVEYDEEYEHLHNARAAAEIQELLETMEERAACKELEKERINELNELAGEIPYGNLHEGVDVRIHRMSEVSEAIKEEYDLIAEPLLDISKRLARALQKHLEDKHRGGKIGALMMGRRLDASAVHRNDGKIFYKKNAPDEKSELAIALLVDESGSMSCSNRYVYARAVSIILQDFCERLNIPMMIYGHSTDYRYGGKEPVALYSYSEFESYDSDDKYRLMDIDARKNNRDGAALRFVSEQLSKREEDIKLLIQICDGEPYADGYSGESAEADLAEIKLEYERRGIIYIVAAIGDDKENIERIYGNSFLDITNLDELPTRLTSIVKKYIRV